MTVLITLRQIKEAGPCQRGWRRVRKSKRELSLDHAFPLVDILDSNGLRDAIWCLGNVDVGSLDRTYQFAHKCIVEASTYGMVSKKTSKGIQRLNAYFAGELSRRQLGRIYAGRDELHDPLPMAIQYFSGSISQSCKCVLGEVESAELHIAHALSGSRDSYGWKDARTATDVMKKAFCSTFG